jgi:integrase
MASVKAVLRKNKKADGTYPIAIRIIKDRKTSFIALGHFVAEDDWDAKNHCIKKSADKLGRLNNLIKKRVAEASDKLIELQTNNTDTSSHAISKAVEVSTQGTFFKQAEIYKKQLEQTGKFNRWSADKPRIERFKEFLGNRDIPFSEITPVLLKQFKAWLHGTRTITERTVVNHLIVIRTIFNQAIAAKHVDPKYYPFGKGGIIIKFPDTLKIGLMPEDIAAIEQAEVNGFENHARNLWLFSFYFAGMRISDVLRLKWSDFQNDRLFYKMGKNDKGGSLKVPAKALSILEQYRREKPKHDLVFPDLEPLANLTDALAVQRYIKTRVKSNNRYLQEVLKTAKVKKTVTMHIARHSFGNIAKGKINIPTLQLLFRHTHLSTTYGYMAHFNNEETDNALDAVLGV